MTTCTVSNGAAIAAVGGAAVVEAQPEYSCHAQIVSSIPVPAGPIACTVVSSCAQVAASAPQFGSALHAESHLAAGEAIARTAAYACGALQ